MTHASKPAGHVGFSPCISDGSDVLIVIPALNEQAHIGSVLARLRADRELSAALIVVADDASTDDTVRIVEQLRGIDLRLAVSVAPRTSGPGAAINRAVREFGRGRNWLIRIDAHADYPVNYASRLLRCARTRSATSVVTPMRSSGTSCFQRAVAAAQNSVLGTGGSAHRMAGAEGSWVEHGHHALMCLATFASLGGYDETFTHNEDAELDHRILKAGGRIWLEPSLGLIYYPRQTVRRLAAQYFHYGIGRAKTVARHSERRRLRQVLPLAIVPALLLAIFALIDWRAALPMLGWMALCLGYGAVLAFKHGRCAVASGIAAIIMQGCWSMGYWRQMVAGSRTPLPKPMSIAGSPAISAMEFLAEDRPPARVAVTARRGETRAIVSGA